MTTSPEYLDQLLAGRALGDLTEEESKLLETILAKDPRVDTEEFDFVVAALVAGSVLAEDELPGPLREAILREAPAHLPNRQVAPAPARSQTTPRSLFTRETLAWAIAVACSVVALVAWWPSRSEPISIQAQREALLVNAPDVIETQWEPGLQPFDNRVAGDVVWSSSLQQGYMRFRNMPINDPAVEQYQLWIIDPERDNEPVDGGVFDITTTGETVVPINAKLHVVSPQAFAITVEQPGGVVVSTQEQLPLLAKVGS